MKLGLEYFWQIVEQKKDLNRVPKFTAMCAMKACIQWIACSMANRKMIYCPFGYKKILEYEKEILE